MKVTVIIPAAGASTRYAAGGGLRHKLDEDLGGKPVLQRTLEAFTKFDHESITIAGIVVAGPHDDAAFREFQDRHGDRLALLGAALCRGGAEHRWQTVQAALARVPADATHVAVHDAARPCVSEGLLTRVMEAARTHGAAIPAIPLADTLKQVEQTDEPEAGADPLAAIFGSDAPAPRKLRVVTRTLDRSGLVLVQTPQVFEAGLLRRAYEQADLSSTDDASLVERLGHRVAVVDGEERNIKITRPADLDVARAIMGFRAPEGRPTHKKF